MNCEQRRAIESAIGRDLDLIDLVEAIGSREARRIAARQRRAIFAQLKAWNQADGLDSLTDDELLSELTA